MAHPLVEQLRFTRSEFERGLGSVTDPQAQQRFGNMNCISWIVGHLAWQEQRSWLTRAQSQILFPLLNEQLAYGKPACTPSGAEMWSIWREVTQAADPWLDTLDSERMNQSIQPGFPTIGNMLLRMIYHYWYHLGDGMAIRQLLGHTSLPDFVGNLDEMAPYRPESSPSISTEMDKSHFLNLVRTTRAQLDQLVSQVDREQSGEPGVSGHWSLKDMLAHITWHERQILEVLNTRILAGSDLWNLPLDERNQAIYEEHRDLPLDKVLQDYHGVFAQLIQALEKLSEDELQNPDHFRDMPVDWKPWILFAENTYQHYLDHRIALEIWLKSSR